MILQNVLDEQQQLEINRLQEIIQNLSQELDDEKQKLVNADLDYTQLTLVLQQLQISVLRAVGKHKYFEIMKSADLNVSEEYVKSIGGNM